MFCAKRELTGWLCIVFFFLFAPPYWLHNTFAIFGRGDNWLYTVSTLAIILFAGGLGFAFLCFSALAKPALKWSYFALIALSSLAFSAYQRVTGKVLEYTDYLTLLQARDNTFDALREYFNAGLFGFAWLLLLFIGFWSIRRSSRKATFLSSVFFVISVSFFVAVCVYKSGAATNKLPASTALYGLFVAQGFDSSPKEYSYTTEVTPSYTAQASQILMVIDESVRYDYFAQVILPRLKKQSAWHVYDLGLALSMANCSAASNLLLRKLLASENIVDDLQQQGFVWSYARNAGFTRTLIDAQGHGRSHNYFTKQERMLLDQNVQLHFENDAAIVQALDWQAPSQLTWIIKNGAHFPYSKNYPADYHSPYLQEAPEYIRQNSLNQSYINAIDYQTGGFFHAFLQHKHTQPVVLIYTADHGQNIDDRTQATHCDSSMPDEDLATYADQAAVPLVIVSNIALPALALAQQHYKNQFSHRDIAPILLWLMGFTQEETLRPLGINRFIYGSPFGYFSKPPKEHAVNREAYLRHNRALWQQRP